MVTITKNLAAAVAFSAVQALPQATLTTMATPSAATPSAAAPSPDASFFSSLLTAPTAIKRFQLLLTKGQELLSPEALKNAIVFDFNSKAMAAKGALGGKTAAANIESFPILTDLGISTTLGFLDACGINTPHVHPRATEFLTVVEGQIDFGYILENGLVPAGKNAEIAGTLPPYHGTVFPQGSIHYQINNACKPAVFVATLNSADPGTSQVAQNLFGLNPDVVNATLGFPATIDGKNIEQFRKALPVNLAQSVDICLKKCKEQDGGYSDAATPSGAPKPSGY